jgi:hypothetical protein
MMRVFLEYVVSRIPVGGFLEAVISNDLKEAVRRADDENMRNLPAYVAWLCNEAPESCWGSPENYKKWVESVPDGTEGTYDAEGKRR